MTSDAGIDPGRLCNNRCLFCVIGEQRDEHEPWSSQERIKREIRLHYLRGGRSLGFSGGEPTVYPHLLDCIRFAKKTGFERIALCTNGTRLADEKFLESLIRSGVTRFAISIHSHRPEVEDWLTGLAGNWERKIRGIRSLIAWKRRGELKDGLSLSPVLCRPNMLELADFPRFFSDLGIADIRFNFIRPQAYAENDRSLIPRYREAVPRILDLLGRNEKEWKIRLSFGAVPFCVLPEPAWRKEFLLERYFDESVLDLPAKVSCLRPGGRAARTRREYCGKLSGCRNCVFYRRCPGVYWSYVTLYGEEEFEPIRNVPAGRSVARD